MRLYCVAFKCFTTIAGFLVVIPFPENVEVVPLDWRSARVTWRLPSVVSNDPSVNISIYLFNQTNIISRYVLPFNQRHLNLVDLSSDTIYNLKAAINSPKGNSKETNEIIFKTLGEIYNTY